MSQKFSSFSSSSVFSRLQPFHHLGFLPYFALSIPSKVFKIPRWIIETESYSNGSYASYGIQNRPSSLEGGWLIKPWFDRVFTWQEDLTGWRVSKLTLVRLAATPERERLFIMRIVRFSTRTVPKRVFPSPATIVEYSGSPGFVLIVGIVIEKQRERSSEIDWTARRIREPAAPSLIGIKCCRGWICRATEADERRGSDEERGWLGFVCSFGE